MKGRPTFEETYPRYEFSVLVLLGIALGTWLVQRLRRAERRRGIPQPYGSLKGPVNLN